MPSMRFVLVLSVAVIAFGRCAFAQTEEAYLDEDEEGFFSLLTRRMTPQGAGRIQVLPPETPAPELVVVEPEAHCSRHAECDGGSMRVVVEARHPEPANVSAAAAGAPWQLQPSVTFGMEIGHAVWDYSVPPTATGRLDATAVSPWAQHGPSTWRAQATLPCVPGDIHRVTAYGRDLATSAVFQAAGGVTPVFDAAKLWPQAEEVATRREQEQRQLYSEEEAKAFQYTPVHSRLRRMRPKEHLHPAFLAAVTNGSVDALWDLVTPLHDPVPAAADGGDGSSDAHPTLRDAPRVYAFPLLSDAFRDALQEELAAAAVDPNVTFTRPNSMNNYGVVMTELGMGEWVADLMEIFLRPLTALLFPDWQGASLDSLHAFTIRYKHGEDLLLDRHMDDSEVTLNVCLGMQDAAGAAVYFNGVRDHPSSTKRGPGGDDRATLFSGDAAAEEGNGRAAVAAEDLRVHHKPGTALLHVGQHFHGTDRLTAGTRTNMVVWMRSDAFRRSPADDLVRACPNPEP